MKTGLKILYQIGDATSDYYIFNRGNLSAPIPNAKKSNTNTSNLFDGVSISSGQERWFKDAWTIPVSFMDKAETFNFVQKITNLGLQKVFFVEKTEFGTYKIYFNYGIFSLNTSQPVIQEDKDGNELYRYSASLLFSSPFFYECDNELKYFDENAFDTITPLKLDSGWQLDDGYKLDNTFTTTFPAITTLTLDAQIATFDDQDGFRLPLQYNDRFFAQDIKTLSSSNTKTVSLTNNNVLNTTSAELNYLETTAESRAYLIEIEPLAQDNWVEIRNTSNNTGIRITWTDPTANSNNIIYNSVYGTFYDKVSGNEISRLTKINIDVATGAKDFLFFSPLLNKNPYLTITSENMSFQKNSSSTRNIILNILKTYN